MLLNISLKLFPSDDEEYQFRSLNMCLSSDHFFFLKEIFPQISTLKNSNWSIFPWTLPRTSFSLKPLFFLMQHHHNFPNKKQISCFFYCVATFFALFLLLSFFWATFHFLFCFLWFFPLLPILLSEINDNN